MSQSLFDREHARSYDDIESILVYMSHIFLKAAYLVAFYFIVIGIPVLLCRYFRDQTGSLLLGILFGFGVFLVPLAIIIVID